jgi:hypothetical protein
MNINAPSNPAPRWQPASSQGVVALESTVISHGLPYPHNLDLARAMEGEVRNQPAQPATVGVVAGMPTVGMSDADIERFAVAQGILKLSRRDIGYAVALGHDGATTVAATMALAALAGVQVFATGGIGGVHRSAHETWDISADLTELARTPVLVVCAGAKAILDLPATIEYPRNRQRRCQARAPMSSRPLQRPRPAGVARRDCGPGRYRLAGAPRARRRRRHAPSGAAARRCRAAAC